MKKPAPRRSAKPGIAGKPTFGKSADGKRSFAKPSAAGKGGFKKEAPFGKPATGEKRPFSDKPAAGEKRPFGKPVAGEKRPFGKPVTGEKRPFGKPVSDERRPFAKPGIARSRPFNAAGDDDFTPPSRPPGRPPRQHGRTFDRAPEEVRSFDAPLEIDRGSAHRGKGPAPRRRLEAALDFDDVIYGVHSVEEALRAGEKINRLYVGHDRERDATIREMLTLAKDAKVEVIFEGPSFFSRFPYKAHQNIVAIGQPFEYISLDEAIALRKTNRLIVLLDHLTDPHNVGAILRSAECAGAQAVVLPDRRSAGINATVRKGAAGAASHLPIAKVGNISAAIRALKAADFTVVGAALEDRAVTLTKAHFGDDVALVIGAEGTGLSKLVAKNCDELVKIPLLGKVESLNASVATGVILYEIVRRRLSGHSS